MPYLHRFHRPLNQYKYKYMEDVHTSSHHVPDRHAYAYPMICPAGPTANILLAALNCKTNGSTSNLDLGWQRIHLCHHDLRPPGVAIRPFEHPPIDTTRLTAFPPQLHTTLACVVASSSLTPTGPEIKSFNGIGDQEHAGNYLSQSWLPTAINTVEK